MDTIQEKDRKVETFLGSLLLTGVIISAIFVLIGGILYLFQHGTQVPKYAVFVDNMKDLKNFSATMKGVFAFKSLSIIHLGILILIATPVMRVAFSVAAFFYEKDHLYIFFTLIVLAILLYSLFIQSMDLSL